mgnify:FL=1
MQPYFVDILDELLGDVKISVHKKILHHISRSVDHSKHIETSIFVIVMYSYIHSHILREHAVYVCLSL